MIKEPKEALAEQNILLFDGECILCNGFVRFLLARDKQAKFRFAALQSAIGQKLLLEQHLSTTDMNSVVLIQNNKHYLKSKAALMVLKEFGGVWKLFIVFLLVPRPIRDFLYDIVAKNRYRWFGKMDACVLPSEEEKGRFLGE
jgi:predicted DCC family thiol-disulfide oxidoreductase YuxK